MIEALGGILMLAFSSENLTRFTDTPLSLHFHIALTHGQQAQQALSCIFRGDPPNGVLCVVIFDVYQSLRDTGDPLPRILENAANILLRQLGDAGDHFLLGEWNCCLTALVWPKDPDLESSHLYDLCYRAQAQMENSFSRPVQCAISNRKTVYSDIPNAAAEAYEAIAFAKYISHPPKVIAPQADYDLYGCSIPVVPRLTDSAQLELCHQIARAIQSNHPSALSSIISGCATSMIGAFPRISAIHFNVVSFCLALESVLVQENIIGPKYMTETPLIPELLHAENEQAFRRVLDLSLQQILTYNMQKKYSKFADSMTNVMAYMEEHLASPSLSIGSIADALGLSASTLTSHFKQFYGDSIPNTIHKKRISRIRTQMLTTNKSVKQLATENGYVSIATMNRAFLKYEGVYPGALKNQLLAKPAEG
jgi:AraC-like DNA-binding protein